MHLRSYAIGVMPKLELASIPARDGGSPDDAIVDRRAVLFARDGERSSHETPFYDRSALRADDTISGPAVIEQLDSTTVLAPGTLSKVLGDGTIVIDVEGERG